LATVGGSKVTRADLSSFLEAQQGEQVLPYLIDTQLIFENLKSKGLEVTDAEVTADLDRRKANDPSAAALIAAGGSKLETAKQQVKRDLAVQKLLTADIKATDAQIKSFFEKNRTYYDTNAKARVGLLFASTKTRADLLARQLAQKTKTFEALVEEQKKANDPVAGQSSADRGTFEGLENFPPNIATQITKIAKGATTTPQSLQVGLPTPVYVIFKKVDFQPAKKADLTALRPQVETDYKLAEAAKKTVAQNPQNPPFEETLKRTQQFMQSQNPTGGSPGLREVLNYINQTSANALLTTLRTAGTVQVDDPTYAKVAEAYKPAATAGAPGAATGNTASSAAPAGNTAPAAP
jgi:foldase protein PrsA